MLVMPCFLLFLHCLQLGSFGIQLDLFGLEAVNPFGVCLPLVVVGGGLRGLGKVEPFSMVKTKANYDELQESLHKLDKWATLWQMKFSAGKCKMM